MRAGQDGCGLRVCAPCCCRFDGDGSSWPPTAVRPLLAWRYQREEGERQIRSEARSGGSKARLEVAELNPVVVELDLVSPAMAPACCA